MSGTKLTTGTHRRRVTAIAIIGAAGALTLGVMSPIAVAAQPKPEAVTVTIAQKGDYVAALCAADTLEGRCLEDVKKGDTKTFTVKPQKGTQVEVRVVVNGGGSAFVNVAPDGSALCMEAAGTAAKPTATKVACGAAPTSTGQSHDPGHSSTAPAPTNPAPSKPAKGTLMHLTAELNGAQEVPAPNGAAVGDRDGSATALVEVKGDRVTFALKWKNVSPLTLGHIHQGVAGQNGPVKVTFFGTAMPDTVSAAAGQVVIDAKLADDIRGNPAGFYVNLHSTEFPGGAVRGQLKPANKRINVLDIIKGGRLHAKSNGAQEVPVAGGPAVGDRDGHAITFVEPNGGSVDFSLAWVNIAAPTLGHVHQGKNGQNGPVKITFFGTAVPANIFVVSGTASNVDRAVVDELKRNPAGFYSNLHTAEFPGGAVRGQFRH